MTDSSGSPSGLSPSGLTTPGGLGLATARGLHRIAERGVRVHCLTNTVAEPITANTLLAVGAVPSLTGDPDELRDFLTTADALMINLGTPDPERRAARRLAARLAGELGLPWVLDPVMADRAAPRRAEAVALLAGEPGSEPGSGAGSGAGPTAVRCNPAEAAALTRELLTHDGVSAVTGPVDRVVYRDRRARLGGGDAMTAKVTASGCALSALVAAFLAVDRDAPFRAVLCALAAYNAAAAHAGTRATGPGGFASGLLDALSDLTAERVAQAAVEFEIGREGDV